jgi:hypothetical protein
MHGSLCAAQIGTPAADVSRDGTVVLAIEPRP